MRAVLTRLAVCIEARVHARRHAGHRIHTAEQGRRIFCSCGIEFTNPPIDAMPVARYLHWDRERKTITGKPIKDEPPWQ